MIPFIPIIVQPRKKEKSRVKQQKPLIKYYENLGIASKWCYKIQNKINLLNDVDYKYYCNISKDGRTFDVKICYKNILAIKIKLYKCKDEVVFKEINKAKLILKDRYKEVLHEGKKTI